MSFSNASHLAFGQQSRPTPQYESPYERAFTAGPPMDCGNPSKYKETEWELGSGDDGSYIVPKKAEPAGSQQ